MNEGFVWAWFLCAYCYMFCMLFNTSCVQNKYNLPNTFVSFTDLREIKEETCRVLGLLRPTFLTQYPMSDLLHCISDPQSNSLPLSHHDTTGVTSYETTLADHYYALSLLLKPVDWRKKLVTFRGLPRSTFLTQHQISDGFSRKLYSHKTTWILHPNKTLITHQSNPLFNKINAVNFFNILNTLAIWK